MSKNTTDEQMKHYNKIIEQFDSVHMPAKQREIIMTEIEQLISNREKLAYKDGYIKGGIDEILRHEEARKKVEQELDGGDHAK